MPWVYILVDENGTYYIGSTNNLERRLAEHDRGKTHTTVRMKKPVLAWSDERPSLPEVRFMERKIKKWKSKKMIGLLINGIIRL